MGRVSHHFGLFGCNAGDHEDRTVDVRITAPALMHAPQVAHRAWSSNIWVLNSVTKACSSAPALAVSSMGKSSEIAKMQSVNDGRVARALNSGPMPGEPKSRRGFIPGRLTCYESALMPPSKSQRLAPDDFPFQFPRPPLLCRTPPPHRAHLK